jgi:transmembrane sensor
MKSSHPSRPDGSESARARLAAAAASWRARQDAGLTVAEQEEFLRWLEADPRHAECFGEMAETWALLDRVHELPEAALAPAPRIEARRARAATWWRWVALPLAAAAAVVLGRWTMTPTQDFVVQFAESTPAEEGLLKRVNLPDGSVVRLRAATAIDVLYGPKTRHVRLLRGEAHFAVAKDAGRPFVVESHGVGVHAVGTAFTVASRGDAVEILVTEGRVRLESARTEAAGSARPPPATAASAPLLEAGEKAVVSLGEVLAEDARTAVERIPPAQLATAIAWQERMLAFDAAPLTAIVAEFNRFNRHQLVVADAALGSRRFGGSFRADDPDGFVALLTASSDVAVEKRERETVIRSR